MREPRGAARPARRGGDPRPREPARPRRPRPGRRLRGAAGRPRPRGARRRGAGAGGRAPRAAHTKAGYVWAGRDYPAARVSLRSTGAGVLHDRRRLERHRARDRRARRAPTRPCTSGAIYLHLGESYRVARSTSATRTAVVEPFSRRLLHAGEDRDDDRDRRAHAPRAAAGGASSPSARSVVTDQVVGYQKKSIQTQESIELVALELPQTEFETEAIWFLPEAVDARGTGARCPACSARCTRPSTR